MRILLLQTGLLTFGWSHSQLINPSFEYGTMGWTVPCECAPAYPTPGGAPGGGGQCLGLDNVNLDCVCMVLNATQQATPWVTPGTWVLSGWIKSAVPGDIPGSFLRFSEGPAFSGQILSNLASSSGDWEFVSDVFIVENLVELDSLRISLVPDDGNEQPPSICYFDDIQLAPELNTAIAHPAAPSPAFRPNPATDRIWVDLPEPALSISAIDDSGRTHDLQDFTHREHTLEVDIEAFPPGICLLRMTTASGVHTVRFVKA